MTRGKFNFFYFFFHYRITLFTPWRIVVPFISFFLFSKVKQCERLMTYHADVRYYNGIIKIFARICHFHILNNLPSVCSSKNNSPWRDTTLEKSCGKLYGSPQTNSPMKKLRVYLAQIFKLCWGYNHHLRNLEQKILNFCRMKIELISHFGIIMVGNRKYLSDSGKFEEIEQNQNGKIAYTWISNCYFNILAPPCHLHVYAGLLCYHDICVRLAWLTDDIDNFIITEGSGHFSIVD